MSVLLVSPKDKGNTYDVLRYVEKNSEAKLMIIGKDENYDLNDFETIIIGSGVYGSNLHKDLQKWLNQIDKTSVHNNAKFYTFFTWIGRGKSDRIAMKKVANILEKKSIILENDYITCFGKMVSIRHKHPNDDDKRKVLNWVKSKL